MLLLNAHEVKDDKISLAWIIFHRLAELLSIVPSEPVDTPALEHHSIVDWEHHNTAAREHYNTPGGEQIDTVDEELYCIADEENSDTLVLIPVLEHCYIPVLAHCCPLASEHCHKLVEEH